MHVCVCVCGGGLSSVLLPAQLRCCRHRPAANTNRSANPNAESMLCNLTHSNSASAPSTTSTVDARATALCATDGKRRLLSVGTRGANAVSRAASNCCANVPPGCLLPVEPAAPVAGAAVAAASDLACAKCAVRLEGNAIL